MMKRIYMHNFALQQKLIQHCKPTILQLKKKKPGSECYYPVAKAALPFQGEYWKARKGYACREMLESWVDS